MAAAAPIFLYHYFPDLISSARRRRLLMSVVEKEEPDQGASVEEVLKMLRVGKLGQQKSIYKKDG